jgi:adenine phosphoribosyltransferase
MTSHPALSAALKNKLLAYPDFPKPGILFQDITPIFHDSALVGEIIEFLAKRYSQHQVDAVLGLEARGFILAPMLALALKSKFIPVRKAGKLPGKTHQTSFVKEYGDPHHPDTFEISTLALTPGERVLIFDDLIALGETLRAAEKLVELSEATTLESICLIELLALKGREKLRSPFFSILQL